MHNMDGSSFLDWGHGFGMFFWWGIFIVAIVFVVIFLVKRGSQDEQEKESPLEIAKRRYAKGEISKEEFEEIKKNLV
ncbi:SHOCT domain-containing protein [Bacteriovoracaceae bacterium]|nr:SHOCT domain-containing protein [Bacteriovoracaceae bacterium]